MPSNVEERVLDLLGPQQLIAASVTAPAYRLSLAAGVGVGDLFGVHLGSPQRQSP